MRYEDECEDQMAVAAAIRSVGVDAVVNQDQAVRVACLPEHPDLRGDELRRRRDFVTSPFLVNLHQVPFERMD